MVWKLVDDNKQYTGRWKKKISVNMYGNVCTYRKCLYVSRVAFTLASLYRMSQIVSPIKKDHSNNSTRRSAEPRHTSCDLLSWSLLLILYAERSGGLAQLHPCSMSCLIISDILNPPDSLFFV